MTDKKRARIDCARCVAKIKRRRIHACVVAPHLLSVGWQSDDSLPAFATSSGHERCHPSQTPHSPLGIHLTGLKKLEGLSFFGTHLTDASMIHLEKLTSLEFLGLKGTEITPAGIANLKNALPECFITGL